MSLRPGSRAAKSSGMECIVTLWDNESGDVIDAWRPACAICSVSIVVIEVSSSSIGEGERLLSSATRAGDFTSFIHGTCATAGAVVCLMVRPWPTGPWMLPLLACIGTSKGGVERPTPANGSGDGVSPITSGHSGPPTLMGRSFGLTSCDIMMYRVAYVTSIEGVTNSPLLRC